MQKIKNKPDCSFISDNLRAKNLRGFLDKLLWFAVKWRFSLLGSIHSAAKTLQQITHCGCSTPLLSATLLYFWSLSSMRADSTNSWWKRKRKKNKKCARLIYIEQGHVTLNQVMQCLYDCKRPMRDFS